MTHQVINARDQVRAYHERILVNANLRQHRQPSTNIKRYRDQCACAFAQHELIAIHNKGRVIAHVKGTYLAKLCKHVSYKAMPVLRSINKGMRFWGGAPQISHKQLVWLEDAQYSDGVGK